MKINATKKYTHIIPEEKSAALFLENFKKRYAEFSGNQLIIDFSEKINIGIKEILLFLETSIQHKKGGTSFVIICKGIDIDTVPEDINVVPTFTEAIDILEMDAIERDLGF
jgi:hypothetical protein